MLLETRYFISYFSAYAVTKHNDPKKAYTLLERHCWNSKAVITLWLRNGKKFIIPKGENCALWDLPRLPEIETILMEHFLHSQIWTEKPLYLFVTYKPGTIVVEKHRWSDKPEKQSNEVVLHWKDLLTEFPNSGKIPGTQNYKAAPRYQERHGKSKDVIPLLL